MDYRGVKSWTSETCLSKAPPALKGKGDAPALVLRPIESPPHPGPSTALGTTKEKIRPREPDH